MAPIEPASESCGSCHASEYEAWLESPHGRSSESPVFLALVGAVRSSWGDSAARRCEACHAPGHDGSNRVGCVSCHLAVGNRGTRDGLLVVDLSAPIAAPHPPTSDTPHATRPGELLRSPVLCATCHTVTGPRHFVESTYDELLAAPSAEAGRTCQSCHMPSSDGWTDHRLTSVTPAWGRPDALVAERRADAAELLASALQLELARPPGGGPLTLRLTNVGAGHAVPTGATLVRELWVELRGADGGSARALTLGARMSAGGESVALPTEADTVAIDALAEGESRTVLVSLAPPVEAILYARPVRADAARALGFDPEALTLAPIEVLRVRAE